MSADLELVRRLSTAERGLAVIATTRPDGSVHASLVNAGVLDHPLTGAPVIATVVRAEARKLVHLRRAHHATVVFRSGYEWVAVDGDTVVVGPDDQVGGMAPDALPGLLRDVFRAAGGAHDDWTEFDRVMAAERRAVVLVDPARLVGNG